MKISDKKQKLVEDFTAELKSIEGVKAIVLGGSFAVGLATESSDLDIGIYYSEKSPFEIEKIKTIASKFSNKDLPTVTGFYEWGPWVNGGAWITTANGEVDLLYKNINQIVKTIDDAKNGVWENSFDQQPPYGFSSIIFLAETRNSIPLYDPENIIGNLKDSIKQYPEKLKQSVVQQSLWSAEFTIWQAEKFANKTDMYNTIGCLTRAINGIVTTLFALNEIYPMGDKRAIEIIEKEESIPSNFKNKIDTILSCEKKSLVDNVRLLKILFNETVELANELYRPYYKL